MNLSTAPRNGGDHKVARTHREHGHIERISAVSAALLAGTMAIAGCGGGTTSEDEHNPIPKTDSGVTDVGSESLDVGKPPSEKTAVRAEIAKLLVMKSGVTIDTTDGPHFSDVKPGDWFYEYVETAVNDGFMSGYVDGTFKPAGFQNRAEFAKEVMQTFTLSLNTKGGPHFSDVASGDWFYKYVETLYNWSVVDGEPDGTFGPAVTVTRAEASNWVDNALHPVARK